MDVDNALENKENLINPTNLNLNNDKIDQETPKRKKARVETNPFNSIIEVKEDEYFTKVNLEEKDILVQPKSFDKEIVLENENSDTKEHFIAPEINSEVYRDGGNPLVSISMSDHESSFQNNHSKNDSNENVALKKQIEEKNDLNQKDTINKQIEETNDSNEKGIIEKQVEGNNWLGRLHVILERYSIKPSDIFVSDDHVPMYSNFQVNELVRIKEMKSANSTQKQIHDLLQLKEMEEKIRKDLEQENKSLQNQLEAMQLLVQRQNQEMEDLNASESHAEQEKIKLQLVQEISSRNAIEKNLQETQIKLGWSENQVASFEKYICKQKETEKTLAMSITQFQERIDAKDKQRVSDLLRIKEELGGMNRELLNKAQGKAFRHQIEKLQVEKSQKETELLNSMTEVKELKEKSASFEAEAIRLRLEMDNLQHIHLQQEKLLEEVKQQATSVEGDYHLIRERSLVMEQANTQVAEKAFNLEKENESLKAEINELSRQKKELESSVVDLNRIANDLMTMAEKAKEEKSIKT